VAFVLDASIAGAWLFEDERSWLFEDERSAFTEFLFDRLDRERAIVPTLWWFEVRNLAAMNERRGRVTPTQTELFLLKMQDLAIERDDLPVSDDLLRLARQHRLTVYDAAYLELAQRLGVELATLDQRLVNAARAEGVRVASD
jgi:predicted nucleic acid-binding protein